MATKNWNPVRTGMLFPDQERRFFCSVSRDSVLDALEETSFFTRPSDDEEIYRLWCNPAFYPPFAVILESRKCEYFCRWKVARTTCGFGDYGPEKEGNFPISKFMWNKFIARLLQQKFWPSEPLFNICIDGDEWLFEGRVGEYYLVKYECCPSKGPFYEMAHLMVSLVVNNNSFESREA